MGLWVVSTFLLLWVMLLWTLVYKYLFEFHLSLPVGIYLRMGLLEHMKVDVLLFEKQPNCFPQFSSVTQSSPTLYDPVDCSMPGITNSRSLPKRMFIELVMPTSHLILCRPLLLQPSIFPSIRVFSNELALCIRWPKYWSFSFNISPSNEHSGLISFRMDWLDLIAVSGLFYNTTVQKFSTGSAVFYNLTNRDPISLWEHLLFFIF